MDSSTECKKREPTADLCLQGSPFQRDLEPKYPRADIRPQQSTIYLVPQTKQPKGGHNRQMSQLGWILFHQVSPNIVAYILWAWPILIVSQPESPTLWHVKSNWVSTKTGRHTWHTQGTLLEHWCRWSGKINHWATQNSYYLRTAGLDWET